MNIVNKPSSTSNPQTSIAITAGETVAMVATLTINGTPINLAGYTLKMQIAANPAILLNTTNGGITVTDAANGVIQVNMSSAVTADILPGAYLYDLWMVSSGSVETILLSGLFAVTSNVAPVP